jgi:hypothetical protein
MFTLNIRHYFVPDAAFDPFLTVICPQKTVFTPFFDGKSSGGQRPRFGKYP